METKTKRRPQQPLTPEQDAARAFEAAKELVIIAIKERIEKELPRKPGQTVRATPIVGRYYRVNWFETVGFSHRIADSKFYKVTLEVTPERKDGILVYEDQSIHDKPKDQLSVFL